MGSGKRQRLLKYNLEQHSQMINHVKVDDGDQTRDQPDTKTRPPRQERQRHDRVPRDAEFDVDEYQKEHEGHKEGQPGICAMGRCIDCRGRRQVLQEGADLRSRTGDEYLVPDDDKHDSYLLRPEARLILRNQSP